MKKYFNLIMMSCVLVAAMALTGCEAGLTSGNGSGDGLDEDFSFSEIYRNIKNMKEEIALLKNENMEQKIEIDTLKGLLGSDGGGLVNDVAALKDTVGDSTSGLVLSVGEVRETLYTASTGLVDAVGDSTSGLVKDVDALEKTVGNTSSGLVKYVDALEKTVGNTTSGIVKDVDGLQLKVGSFTSSGLSNRIGSLEKKLSGVTRKDDDNGYDTLTFSEMNVQINSGSGSTHGPSNGLGNLVIGYNEPYSGPGGARRWGSHYIVVGPENEYWDRGGLVIGHKATNCPPYGAVIQHLYYEVSGEHPTLFRP
ncbi:MAG: hypothetical protein GY754_33435 [bacterium]|nr:hypothetical protein [bacterium]